MPFYSYVGMVVLLVSEVAMFARIEPFWSWHTPIAWTGYILIVDGAVYKRRRSSWLTTNRPEFLFLAAVSIPLWVVFEGYNLLIRNWHYVNLPENVILRYFGYAWSFATISPTIFETGDLFAAFRRPSTPDDRRPDDRRPDDRRPDDRRPDDRRPDDRRPADRRPDDRRWTIDDRRWTILGAGFLLLPIIYPSPYLAAPVFLGFIFLLDPFNRILGSESLSGDLAAGRTARLVDLSLSGLVCGVLWEFWNYWSRSKWIYDVPIMQNMKIFEMPVPGYLGFPPFALECFTMYVLVRYWFWRGAERPIAI